MSLVNVRPFGQGFSQNLFNVLNNPLGQQLGQPVVKQCGPQFGQHVGKSFNHFAGADMQKTIPAVNIMETPTAWHLVLGAPGLAKEDFKIALDQYVLTISAGKNTATESNEGDNANSKPENATEAAQNVSTKYTRKEYNYHTFSRAFNLPKTVSIDNIEATYLNGELTVLIPKKEEALPKEARNITIK